MKLLIGLILILFTGSTTVTTTKTSDFVNKELPDFSGTSLNNIDWSKEKLAGKVSLINFWFIGCPPCVQEIPYLNEINADYEDENFVLLGIAPQLKEDLMAFNDTTTDNVHNHIRNLLGGEVIEYEVIPACDQRTLKSTGKHRSIGPECDNIIKDFGVNAFPATFIVDKKGIVRQMKYGFSSSESMQKYKTLIDKLLKE